MVSVVRLGSQGFFVAMGKQVRPLPGGHELSVGRAVLGQRAGEEGLAVVHRHAVPAAGWHGRQVTLGAVCRAGRTTAAEPRVVGGHGRPAWSGARSGLELPPTRLDLGLGHIAITTWSRYETQAAPGRAKGPDLPGGDHSFDRGRTEVARRRTPLFL